MPETSSHLHLGGKENARRAHEQPFVLHERMEHVKLVEEYECRRHRFHWPAPTDGKGWGGAEGGWRRNLVVRADPYMHDRCVFARRVGGWLPTDNTSIIARTYNCDCQHKFRGRRGSPKGVYQV